MQRVLKMERVLYALRIGQETFVKTTVMKGVIYQKKIAGNLIRHVKAV